VTRRARLVIDPIACDGRGLCAELLPDLIALDDWGFPVILAALVPAGMEREARTVARLCPRLALQVERVPRTGNHPPRGTSFLNETKRLGVAVSERRRHGRRFYPGKPDDHRGPGGR
jgi:ferredoxin